MKVLSVVRCHEVWRVEFETGWWFWRRQHEAYVTDSNRSGMHADQFVRCLTKNTFLTRAAKWILRAIEEHLLRERWMELE